MVPRPPSWAGSSSTGTANVPGVSGWLTIEDLRQRIDDYRAAEWALCEHLGRWARDDADPAARREFAAASARHGWHLQLWDERRPQINTVAPAPEPVALDGAADLSAAATTAHRRAAFATVLDRLGADYRAHQAATDATIDPATAETLRRILA